MKQRLFFIVALVLVILTTALAAPLQAQLNETCTVSVLNRSVQVQPDGSWVLPNVPANAGLVRARATCVENGITRSGQSDYFLVPVDGLVEVAQIEFSTPQPIALSLALTTPSTTLSAAGVTAQITATAAYSDGTTANISRGSQGTNWFTTNANVVSVSPDGVVTARASGTAIISAMNEGALGLLQISVVAAADSDNDGLPDTFEIANGLDPNNPADALTDLDNDGLSNVEEFRHGSGLRTPDSDGDGLLDGDEVNRGTNPTVKDSDGDGVGDGLEVQAGTNPLDPNSVSYNGILASLSVAPSTVDIVINTVIGEGSRVVKVTGTLIDGTVVDLTSRARGTTYNSDNLGIASFGIVDGQIFGGTNGSANVTIANAGRSATIRVNVTSFAPTALGYVLIPGFANNVDVAGNYAYVAAGSTGLQVVDVSNHTAPRIVASLDTNGNANDVRIVGGFAYVADGTAGLKIIDISNPLAPRLSASLATGGDAWDVVVYSGRAYIAAGPAGLKIADVSNPAAPVLLGGIDTPGTAKGVDVSGNIAAVADGGPTLFIDVTTPSAPVIRGSAPTSEARDVTVDGNFAYVADFQASLRVVDFTNPQSPQVVATEDRTLGGLLNDVERAGSYLFGADVFFVHGVPISNVQVPASPIVRARLDIPYRDDNDTGIAVDSQYVYVTGSRDMTENGGSGDTALYIGQWLKATDNTNVPPSVQLTSPVNVPTIIEGSTLHLAATATDDVMVAAVDFLADGVVVATRTAAPYEFDYRIATGITSIRIQARARDLANNQGVTPEVTISVIPDPGTTATGRVVYEDGSTVSGATVTCFDQSRQTNSDGTFAVPGLPTIRGNIACTASFVSATDGNTYNGGSGSLAPIAGGNINFGDIVVHGTVEISQLAKSAWGVPAAFLARTLAAEGTKLVVAPYSASDRLVVLDTTDAAHPAFVKNVQGGNNEIYDVAVRGGWAYVASYDFCTINLNSGATGPNCVGLGGGELAVAPSGNYVFAARNGSGGWIRVYDVTNPGSPRYLREQSMGGGVDYTRLIPMRDEYLLAIANDGAHDVVVIDRRDVNSFGLSATLDIPNFTAWRGVLRGSLLYLAGNQPELVIVDLSNPASPQVVGRQAYSIGQGRGIAASDAEAWIGSGTGQVAVMNVTAPSAPSFTRSLNATGATWDTIVSGTYAYTANENGIAVMHLSTSPVIEPSRITVGLQGTLASITGAVRAISGLSPMTVEIADTKSGASITGIAVAGDGSFSATLPAAPGDPITVRAFDSIGRTGGPISVGSVPFGPAANITFITPAQTDGSFRARTLASEGDILVATGWGEDQGQSDKVAIYDISNPASPQFKRSIAGGNNVTYQMEIHNGWAFIASYDFCTLNVASPTASRNCVGLGGGELAVTVSGNYAFATRNGNGGWIRVYDVTNPASPRYLREQNFFNGVDFYHVAQLGTDYLVALGPYGGASKNLFVINRRDVNSLSLVTSINIPNFTPFRGRIYGNLFYISGFDGKSAIVDLTNPASPVVKSVFTTGGLARGIDVAGTTAAIADGGAGVRLADVTNPAAPSILGLQPAGGNAWDALFAKGVLYVANEQGIVTISNVVAPPQIDTNAITITAASTTSASITGAVRAVTGQAPLVVELKNVTANTTNGNIAVAADGSFTATISARPGDVLTIKATDKDGRVTGPLQLGSVPFGSAATSIFITPAQTDGSFRARTLASEGNILVATGWGEDQGQSDKVVIYDISNPASPQFKRSVAGGNNVTYQMEIHNGWAFIASYDFCTLNVASPTASRNCVGLGGGELAVTVSGNYAFATRNGNGGWIRVYDVTNPASPRYLREQNFVNGVDFYHLVQLGTDYLVALGPYGGASKNLFVINRRDVNSLSLVTSFNIPNFTPFRGRMYGNLFYVSGFDGKTAIVDMSNPAAPVVLSVYDTGGVSYGVDVAGKSLAVAGGTAGVRFLDTTNPGAPAFLGLQPVGGNAWDALFAGGVLYVANEQGIVVVKDVAAPPSIDESQITVQLQGSGSALVTGAARAVGGTAPLTIALKDDNSGTTISGLPVNADGSFSASIPAQQGDAISLSVTDSVGRVAGPVPVGIVPFGSGLTSLFITPAQTDSSFRARTLATEGSLLVVTGWGEDQGQSDKVVIYDISDPGTPVFKRSVAGGNNVTYQMEIHNGWAYIASYDFCTLNVASPTASRNCVGLGGGELAVTVSGNYAFATRNGNGGWIRVYDVTNPGAPRYLREQNLFNGVDFYHVAQLGTDYLVALGPYGGTSKNLFVIDRRDVNNLVLVTSVNLPNFTPFRGRIHGNLFYISGFDGKSAIVDLTNPAAPVIKSIFDAKGSARGIDAAGTTAITADGTAGVHFHDVSNLTAPVTLGLQPVGGNAWDALFAGGVLYVANEQGLVVVKDVGAPPVVDPALVGVSLANTGSALISGQPHSIAGQGPFTATIRDSVTGASVTVNVASDGSFTSTLPASSGDPISVQATDGASRLSRVTPVGFVPYGATVSSILITPAQTDANFRARSLAQEGNILVALGWGEDQGQSDKVAIFDITNPGAPVFQRALAGGNNVTYQMEIHDGWGYVASYDFCTLNVASPTSSRNCVGLGAVDYAVTVSGPYAFTTRSGAGGWIRVYDVANPAAPRYLREQSMLGGVDFYSMQQLGTNHLVCESPNGTHDVVVIDRRDVNSFAVVADLDIPNFVALRGKLYGNLLYLSGNGSKLAIVDLTNPSAPVVKSVLDTGGVTRGVAVAGAMAAVADGTAGVHFVNTSNLTSPVVTGLQPTGGNAWDALFAAGALYIANEQGIVVVNDVGAPPSIDTRLIAAASTSQTDATVAGQVRSITGRAPLSVTVTDSNTGAQAQNVAVGATGSFNAGVAAKPGHSIMIAAADSDSRIAGPLSAGIVPFGSAMTFVPISPAQSDANFRTRSLAFEGNILVANSWGEDQGQSDKFVIYDITDPAAPVYKRSVIGGNNVTYEMEIHNGWAYVASYDFCTINVADPASSRNCVGLGALDYTVTQSGNYAFTSRSGAGGWLRLYDVSNPAAPFYVREQSMLGGVDFYGMQPYGNYLVCESPNGTHDVVVIDRSNVNNFVKVADIDIPNFTAFRARIAGNLLYISGYGGNMAIVDLTNPAAPVTKAVLTTGGISRGIAVSGNIAAVADGSAISMVSVANPAAPTLLGRQFVRGNSWGTLFNGTTLYVASELGLTVIPNVDTTQQ